MKRRLIILAMALTSFLSVFGGVASLLATGPHPAETAPIAVAGAGPDIKPPVGPPPPGPSPDGASWGG